MFDARHKATDHIIQARKLLDQVEALEQSLAKLRKADVVNIGCSRVGTTICSWFTSASEIQPLLECSVEEYPEVLQMIESLMQNQLEKIKLALAELRI